MVGGDYNTPLNVDDKYGGKINMTTSMEDLRNFIYDNDMIDLQLKGNRLIWSNRRICTRLI